MQKRDYTNINEIMTDLQMYSVMKQGGTLSLGMIQSLAEARWTWIVTNWVELYKRFKLNAFGDQDQEGLLADLDKEVQASFLGSKNNPFSDTKKFYKFQPVITQITLSELRLTKDEAALKNDESDRIARLEVEDFQRMLKYIKKQHAISAGAVGLGDAQGDRLSGVTTSKKQRAATVGDTQELDAADQLYKEIQGIIYDLKTTRARPPDLLKAANINKGSSPILINDTYLSYVPVPFESSLESMALKYLGSKDRWFELVTVNNLQPPFIDQTGTKYTLLSPGAVNNVIIPDTAKENLSVGSKIGIGSYKYKEEKRIVERVISSDNGSMVVFLSGEQTVNKFKPSEGAFVRVYKAQTTRDGEFLQIPLNSPGVALSVPTPSSDELRRLDKAFLNFGIDISRDEKTFDLLLDSNGNFKYSYGFDAIRNAVINAIKTKKNELTFHPDYGVNLAIGDRFFGTADELVIFANLIRATILSDPRFQNVKITNLQSTGTSINLALVVSIQGLDKPIALSFVS